MSDNSDIITSSRLQKCRENGYLPPEVCYFQEPYDGFKSDVHLIFVLCSFCSLLKRESKAESLSSGRTDPAADRPKSDEMMPRSSRKACYTSSDSDLELATILGQEIAMMLSISPKAPPDIELVIMIASS